MLRVFLHIGPHKTGTTMLQSGLLAASRAGAAFHYPEPEEHGPGHARLAWRALGLQGAKPQPEALVQEVERAAERNVEKIVFSAEDFSHAISAKERLEPLQRLSEKFQTELVVTLSTIQHRLSAVMQERIKHGGKFEYWDLKETLAILAKEPSTRPDFLAASLIEIRALRNHVIFVDRAFPEKLFTAISDVLGVDVPIPTRAPRNARIPFFQARFLSIVNQHFPSLRGHKARQIAEAAYEAAAAKEDAVADLAYPEPPPEIVALLNQISAAQHLFLDQFMHSGRLTIHGRAPKIS